MKHFWPGNAGGVAFCQPSIARRNVPPATQSCDGCGFLPRPAHAELLAPHDAPPLRGRHKRNDRRVSWLRHNLFPVVTRPKRPWEAHPFHLSHPPLSENASQSCAQAHATEMHPNPNAIGLSAMSTYDTTPTVPLRRRALLTQPMVATSSRIFKYRDRPCCSPADSDEMSLTTCPLSFPSRGDAAGSSSVADREISQRYRTRRRERYLLFGGNTPPLCCAYFVPSAHRARSPPGFYAPTICSMVSRLFPEFSSHRSILNAATRQLSTSGGFYVRWA